MPFVPVPKDLTKVKTKIALNLTKRQLICFSCAAAVGVPVYLFCRTAIGSTAAVLLMIGLMLPFFFIAMFERDGQPAEKILRNIIRARWFYPPVRPYKTENLYAYLEKVSSEDGAPAPSESRGARGQNSPLDCLASPTREKNHKQSEPCHHRSGDANLGGG